MSTWCHRFGLQHPPKSAYLKSCPWFSFFFWQNRFSRPKSQLLLSACHTYSEHSGAHSKLNLTLRLKLVKMGQNFSILKSTPPPVVVVVTNISYMQSPISSLCVGETDIGSENSHSDYFGCRLLCKDISTWKSKENFRKALWITLFIHAFEHETQSNESHYITRAL